MDYKTSKEAFVSGMTGSSITHVNMISLVSLFSIALHSSLLTRLPPTSSQLTFIPSFLILILPLLLSVTLFANSPGLLSLIILFPTGVLLLVPRRESGVVLPYVGSPSRGSGNSSEGEKDDEPNEKRRRGRIPLLPALTTYRSHMLMLTFISILAVDFPVFPRSLAKCETFGVSMMDLGVGSFVFSQGLVSSLPMIKNPRYLKEPFIPKLAQTLRKCLPLLILGLLRTVSVKGAEYPEHQTEYGTHWNFFITLGLMPILQVFFHPLIAVLPISLLGVVVALSQQLFLSYGGLASYVLDAPRTTLISHNKEGLVSLIGYLSIHLLGLSCGTLILPPSPSYFRRQQQQLYQQPIVSPTSPTSPTYMNSPKSARLNSVRETASQVSNDANYQLRENDKTAIELFSYAFVWWVFLGFSQLFGVGGGVSRRMVNLQYILYVSAYNTTFMLGYLLLDLLFFASPMSKSVYSPTSKLKVHPEVRRKDSIHSTYPSSPSTAAPAAEVAPEKRGSAPTLLDAVNKNGLVLFLLANVVTGLINLSIPTMYASDGLAMVVLGSYAFGMSGVAWICRGRKLWRF
ncbi:hypothetical protein NLI96_g5316 [Meripilus lineatus]|uniref:GPI-anchored wall transfer protein n=1 Tax=Meripilus lineatus TaxID=2056292 RepID=A0AAD5YJ93_9APHY|nr:hypothetical protein NLI96_g5316 [Physisporinus lineatus]